QGRGDKQEGRQQPGPGGPPRLRLGRGRWLSRRGLGAFALLLEAGDVTLNSLELAGGVVLPWRDGSPPWSGWRDAGAQPPSTRARLGVVRTTAEPIRASWPGATPGGPVASARRSAGPAGGRAD